MKVENVKIESSGIDKRNWSVEVDNNTIRVENTFSTVKLLVNDKVQDVYFGIVGAPHLTGKLPDGKEIKAVIGETLKLRCYIFVDHELVLEG